MALNLGSGSVSVWLGDAFASLYLGSSRVPTVPGPPTITAATYSESPPSTNVSFSAPANGGGASIISYKFYFDGVQQSPDVITSVANFSGDDYRGQECRMSAVNAVGEGPLSDPVTVA